MKSHRSRNLGILSRRFQDFRKKAVTAIEFGQDILVRAMVARAPRHTGRMARSIRKTKVFNDHTKHRLVGKVIVPVRYARFVEYPTKRTKDQPFVRPTQAIDGPLAVQAMIEILTG